MTVPETPDQWRALVESWHRPYSATRRIACLTEWPPLMARPRVPKPATVLALLILVKPYDSSSRITFVDG